MVTRQELAGMIDHSLLKPQSTRVELKKLCAEAVQYAFKAVCINPVHVADAASFLKDSGVIVCSVVGFPFGTLLPKIKAAETREVVRLGAGEIDMVIRVGALKEGRNPEVVGRYPRRGGSGLRPPGQGHSGDLLPDGGRARSGAANVAVEAGAAFVKTSLPASGPRERWKTDVELLCAGWWEPTSL